MSGIGPISNYDYWRMASPYEDKEEDDDGDAWNDRDDQDIDDDWDDDDE